MSDTATVTEQPPFVPEEGVAPQVVPATVAGMPPTAQAFFAVVNGSNGALLGGFQVLSATRFFTGTYQVLFTHDLTGSAYIGTIGINTPSASAPGMITVAPRAGAANGVFVQTFGANGLLADLSFHLAVLS